MFAIAATFLGLVALSLADPHPCEDLTKELASVDTQSYKGLWIFVAGSWQYPGAMTRDSITINFNGTSLTQANRYGTNCTYQIHDLRMEDNRFIMKVPGWNFTGTLLKSSDPNYMVVSLEVVSDSELERFVDLYLLSRGREVTKEAMDEFQAIVGCSDVREALVMDPKKELCPDLTASATEPPKE